MLMEDTACLVVFVFKVIYVVMTLKKLKIDEVKVCLSVCGSIASDSSETIEVIIIKLCMVTASDMVMVLIILT